jgi:hypothetical protein
LSFKILVGPVFFNGGCAGFGLSNDFNGTEFMVSGFVQASLFWVVGDGYRDKSKILGVEDNDVFVVE